MLPMPVQHSCSAAAAGSQLEVMATTMFHSISQRRECHTFILLQRWTSTVTEATAHDGRAPNVYGLHTAVRELCELAPADQHTCQAACPEACRRAIREGVGAKRCKHNRPSALRPASQKQMVQVSARQPQQS
jgi:hypothetical protein